MLLIPVWEVLTDADPVSRSIRTGEAGERSKRRRTGRARRASRFRRSRWPAVRPGRSGSGSPASIRNLAASSQSPS